MNEVRHLSMEELEAGLDEILKSPRDKGSLELICRRPMINEREVLAGGKLNREEGLVGDNWSARRCLKTPREPPDANMQIAIMNSRVISLIAQKKSRWQLAGDQLYLDLHLGLDNLPAKTRFSLGSAVLEVTEIQHWGCKKFADRFGSDALKFVSSRRGRALCLRGIYAKVVEPGIIRSGDFATKI